jgi:hypothetical protein
MDGDDGHRVSNAFMIGYIARHRDTSRMSWISTRRRVADQAGARVPARSQTIRRRGAVQPRSESASSSHSFGFAVQRRIVLRCEVGQGRDGLRKGPPARTLPRCVVGRQRLAGDGDADATGADKLRGLHRITADQRPNRLANANVHGLRRFSLAI